MPIMGKSTRSLVFGEACQPFTDARIKAVALLPVIPPGACLKADFKLDAKSFGKVPGSYNQGAGLWSGLGGDAVTEGMNAEARTRAADWPTGNVGLLGRLCPAIDSDVLSEEARAIVEAAVIETFGTEYAERLRGDGHRRLYAFRSDPKLGPDRRVRNGKIRFLMSGETDEEQAHGIDILGTGKQYLIAGVHPSGDRYRWHPDRDLCAMMRADQLAMIENGDIERFKKALERRLEAAGGRIVSAESGGGGGPVEDHSRSEPLASADTILGALAKVPNTEANFPSHDAFVAVIAAIRAFAGNLALDPDFEDGVRTWAVDSSDGWCDDGYFEKAWESFPRGQRCGRNALVTILRKHGCHALDGLEFPENTADDCAVIAGHKAAAKGEHRALLNRAAETLVFQHQDTSSGRKFQPMRLRASPGNELDAADWYKGRSTDRDGRLLADLHSTFGTGPDGLFNFLRALMEQHPLAFYQGTTKHPRYEYGAVVPQPSDPGRPEGMLNLRRQAQAQTAARKGQIKTHLADADLAHFLEFVRRAFGDPECTKSEGIAERFFLDTLAYMAQTGKRPGHMFYLVGDQGTGKSILVEMVIALFDGTWPGINGRINGAKLTNENARRFIFEPTEGCRVVALQEMPKNARSTDQTAILSELKQAVDPGPGGDWLQVEAKNGKIRHIENHALVIVTTNYEKALEVEEQDRRTFYAPFRITSVDKPARSFYARLVNITEDPERLAAVWRYLTQRDIAGYSVTDAPPTSAEKFALQMAGISDEAERHVEVALRCLEHNGRWLFATADVVQLMNEAWRREPGNDDGPEPYAAEVVGRNGISSAAWARLGRLTAKRGFKSGSTRFPTLYTLKAKERDLNALERSEAFRALALDRENHPLVEMPRIEPYRGALDLPTLKTGQSLDWNQEDECAPPSNAPVRHFLGRNRLQ